MLSALGCTCGDDEQLHMSGKKPGGSNYLDKVQHAIKRGFHKVHLKAEERKKLSGEDAEVRRRRVEDRIAHFDKDVRTQAAVDFKREQDYHKVQAEKARREAFLLEQARLDALEERAQEKRRQKRAEEEARKAAEEEAKQAEDLKRISQKIDDSATIMDVLEQLSETRRGPPEANESPKPEKKRLAAPGPLGDPFKVLKREGQAEAKESAAASSEGPTPPADQTAPSPSLREKVRKKLQETLSARMAQMGEDLLLRPPESLALEIEEELWNRLAGKVYAAQARKAVSSLRDEKGFGAKLLLGELKVRDLPFLTAESGRAV